MKLEYQGKSLEYNLDGSLKGTVVTLGHLDGGYLPVLLQGDQTALSNQELFEEALEQHYQENFPNRAEKEAISDLKDEIEELAKNRLGTHKESFLNQLVSTSTQLTEAQGVLRQIKKAGNQFTSEQLVGIINTLSMSNFQAIDLLRNVIEIL